MGDVLAAPTGWAEAGAIEGATLGETGAAAGWAGTALGGATLGETAAAAGAFLVSDPIGWAILGTAVIAGGAYLGYKAYQNAHGQSQSKFKEKIISQACSTCHDCNDLAKEIENQQQKVDDRYQDMLDDQHGLYQAGPAGIPGKPYLGIWAGHQKQFQGNKVV